MEQLFGTGNFMNGISQVARGKDLPANAGDARESPLIPVLGRSPAVGSGNPFQHSCLENPMDRRVCKRVRHN